MEVKTLIKAHPPATICRLNVLHSRNGSQLAFGSMRVTSPMSVGQRTRTLRICAISSDRLEKKKRVDQSDSLTLESIRHSLIRQEDSIIFGLLERAQYCYNADTYDLNVFSIGGFEGCLVEFMVRETEKLHAQVGRYKSPDEHPFFPNDLPEPLLPPLQYPQVTFLDLVVKYTVN
ncbi:Chorismate mutase 1 [Nymphaea thermarum]|nr:Chorismate mutase 1 [Nymphaea thermarum]